MSEPTLVINDQVNHCCGQPPGECQCASLPALPPGWQYTANVATPEPPAPPPADEAPLTAPVYVWNNPLARHQQGQQANDTPTTNDGEPALVAPVPQWVNPIANHRKV